MIGRSVPYHIDACWHCVRTDAQLGKLRLHAIRQPATASSRARTCRWWVGKLLGLKRHKTTAGYAHLADWTRRLDRGQGRLLDCRGNALLEPTTAVPLLPLRRVYSFVCSDSESHATIFVPLTCGTCTRTRQRTKMLLTRVTITASTLNLLSE